MFGVGQALLLVVLPGGSHLGPVTPTGHRPRYRVNGVAAFAVTWILLVLVAGPLDLVSPELLAHRGRSE